MEVFSSDLKRLNPGQFLNDTIVDFYIKLIQEDESFLLKGNERFYFFNSFFYTKISEDLGTGGASFLSWTRGAELLTKKYIFVPIHKR